MRSHRVTGETLDMSNLDIIVDIKTSGQVTLLK